MNSSPTNKPPAPKHGSEQVAAFRTIMDAARLVNLCDGFWRDEHDRREGWTIHYAVDVDIIKMYSAPADNFGYARIFEAEGEKTEESLADILGRYIMFRLPGTTSPHERSPIGTLFLIPPHDDEFDRVRLGIARDVIAHGDQASDGIKHVVQELTEGLTDTQESWEQLVDRLLDKFFHVVEAFDGLSGIRREAARLAARPRGRLQNLVNARDYAASSPAEAVLPQWEGRSSPDRAAFFESIRFWRERLTRHQSGKKPSYALTGDAQALATLQWVNERTQARKQRLVLITGSANVMDAAEGIQVTIGQESLTFDRAYLRDPRAFTGAREFFDSAQPTTATLGSTTFRLLDWLNLIFPRVLQRRTIEPDSRALPGLPGVGSEARVDLTALKRILDMNDRWINESLDRIAKSDYRGSTGHDFPQGFIGQWIEQIEAVAAQSGVSPLDAAPTRLRAEDFLKFVNETLHSGHTVAHLQEEIGRRVEDSLRGLYLESGELGVLQLLQDGDEVRGVPALRFDDEYPDAQRQSELLCSTLWNQKKTFDLGRAYQELASGDPERYQAHLIHIQVYAARGHWFATRTLCRLALQISDRIPEDEKRGRRGREAAYFLAVAERRLARGLGDLDRARVALKQAMEERETPGTVDVDPRFRSEELALKVTTAQFERFGGKTRPQSYHLDELLATARDILDRVSPSDPHSIRSWVRRQTTTNVLIAALLGTVDGVHTPSEDESKQLVQLIEEFYSASLAPDSPPDERGVQYVDEVSSFIYAAAILEFHADPARREAASSYLEELHRPGAGSMSFERDREVLLRQHLKTRFGSDGTLASRPAS